MGLCVEAREERRLFWRSSLSECGQRRAFRQPSVRKNNESNAAWCSSCEQMTCARTAHRCELHMVHHHLATRFRANALPHWVHAASLEMPDARLWNASLRAGMRRHGHPQRSQADEQSHEKQNDGFQQIYNINKDDGFFMRRHFLPFYHDLI